MDGVCYEIEDTKCAYGCAKCTEESSLSLLSSRPYCDDQVEHLSAFACVNPETDSYIDNQIAYSNCGTKWAQHFDDGTQSDSSDDADNHFYWAFDTEEECQEDYITLLGWWHFLWFLCFVAFMINLITRLGVIAAAFCCPPPSAAVQPGVMGTPMAAMPHGQVMVVTQNGAPQQGQPVAMAPQIATPMAAFPPGQPILPPGWTSTLDSSTGKYYYYNTETQETRWDPPPANGKA